MSGKKAYEATVGEGQKVHGVIRDDLPRWQDRITMVFTTACGIRVSGSRVYRSPFNRRIVGARACSKCLTRVEEE